MRTAAKIAVVASLAALTAGCMSSGNTATSVAAQPAAAGQAVPTATGGFVSSGTLFTCTGGQLTVSGDSGSITLVSDSVTIPVQGGPLVYRAGVNLVVFDDVSYQRFRVLNGATLVNTCTR